MKLFVFLAFISSLVGAREGPTPKPQGPPVSLVPNKETDTTPHDSRSSFKHRQFNTKETSKGSVICAKASIAHHIEVVFINKC